MTSNNVKTEWYYDSHRVDYINLSTTGSLYNKMIISHNHGKGVATCRSVDMNEVRICSMVEEAFD